MIRSAALIFLFIALVKGQSTQVSQCIMNGGALPLNAYINGCITPPCQLPQEQNAVINLVFRAPRTMRTMRTLATAYLLFVPIPYDLGEEALTCNFLTNSYCPLLEGEVVQYTLNMFIQAAFPAGTSVTIEFRVVDENNSPFVCIRVPVTITPAVGGARNALNSNATISVNV